MDSSSICSLLELGCESDMPIYIYIQTIILNFTTKQKKGEASCTHKFYESTRSRLVNPTMIARSRYLKPVLRDQLILLRIRILDPHRKKNPDPGLGYFFKNYKSFF